ncbi:hypothetical protein [Flagellimonas onchidii]|uniref:hypothetical protein n=1 Tax=Flagellimonas onchidii TaxID=2562684 RepID=UPI0010A5E0D4|nr:hypothetical protein [Allomuricauda onchidii]
MCGIERARLKNKIIEFLLLNKRSAWSEDTLHIKLDEPTETISHFNKIVSEMIVEAPKYFDYNTEDDYFTLLQANDFTKEFHEWGGFVDLYIAEEMRQQDIEQDKEREKHFKNLERENTFLTNKLNKQRLKTHWIPITISIMALLRLLTRLQNQQMKAGYIT